MEDPSVSAPKIKWLRSQRAGVFAIAASLVIFYCATIRSGNYWADDYALYILHARNIVNGSNYAATGYVFNPAALNYSPSAYPPVFPLLLAPAYKLFGMNLRIMKAEEVFFFFLALVVIAIYWKREFGPALWLGFIALLGFSPVFWIAKDAVDSDLPFLFFFYSTALLIDSAPRTGRKEWLWAVAAGVATYLCVGTRAIGFTVVPGLVLYDVLKLRKIARFTGIAIGTSIFLLFAQMRLFGRGEGSYTDHLHLSLSGIGSNAVNYLRDLMLFWPGHSSRILWYGIVIVASVLFVLGFRQHFKCQIRAVDALLAPYLFAIVIWPYPQGMRFLFPVLPFYLAMVLMGFGTIFKLLPRRIALDGAVAFFALVSFFYVAAYRYANLHTIQAADGLSSFNQLCDFVRDNTARNDVFVFRRSRALSLFASRSAAVYLPKELDENLNFMHRAGASYVVSSPLFDEDRKFLIPFLHRFSTQFDLVYENRDFQLYKMRDDQTRAAR